MKTIILLLTLICTINITKAQVSSYTKELNQQIKNYLPLNNQEDFINAKKGFIATLPQGEIKDEKGRITYNIKQFDFLKKDAPESVNPSLWRQSQLNHINGLFEVSQGIYQIRNFDLSNMTLIKGEKGWIIIDPLLTAPSAKAGLELANLHLGKRPVSAIIITHSHVDHFGGIRGVVDEKDVISGKVKIYAPEGFFNEAISENVMGGNAMGRRASYMFGNLLPKNNIGNVGSGLGVTTSSGTNGILKATNIINTCLTMYALKFTQRFSLIGKYRETIKTCANKKIGK